MKKLKVTSKILNEMFEEKKLQWDDANSKLFLNGEGWATAPNDFWDYAHGMSDEASDIVVSDGLECELIFKF